MLKEENFPVENIKNSTSLADGSVCLAQGGIDVVLLDLGLPDSQGIDTLERFHSVANHVPIVILTGFKDDTLGLEAVRGGAQDYLVKGKLDGALLLKSLNYAVERKKLDEAIKREADLIDLSPDGIIIKKLDGTVTFWSLGAEKMYGYTQAQALGRKTNVLFRTKAAESLQNIHAKLKKDGKWSGEITQKTKAGRELAVQSYWLAKFNREHEIEEIFEQNVDITERKNAERLAAIGATAGMVGHDIRNPLQTIAGEIYLASCVLRGLPDNEFKKSMRESLSIIEEQMIYVNKIVSDLQDFARPLKPKLESVDVKGIVGTILSSINVPKNSNQANSIQVEVSIHQDLCSLKTDKTYLQRILQNLITNSIQAMPQGGKLTVTACIQNKQAVITVEDTGDGIPAELHSKLFTPLITMKSKGQGFGLAVVKRLTEALAGTVSFESEVGKGTKFIVTLPA